MSQMILVDKEALLEVLRALNGPPHLIRELQFTRGLPLGEENPIDVLIENYKKAEESGHKGDHDVT